MNILVLQGSKRLFFTIDDVASILGISKASSRVLASRYVKKGIFTRLKRDLYILESRLKILAKEELFSLSNMIQVPSYVSFMTALSYYGYTTHVTREVIEAVSPIRTREFQAKNLLFLYSKISKPLYFGFTRVSNFFIATPEKALLDCLYFRSLRRYIFDETSLDLRKFSRRILVRFSKKFPKKTREELRNFLHT